MTSSATPGERKMLAVLEREAQNYLRVWGTGYKVQGTRYRVQGTGYRVQGTRYKVQGIGYRV